MKQSIITALTLGLALSMNACNKDKEPETPDAVDEDGTMEEAGEWTDDAAEDTGDAFEDAADETEDEFDGDPQTD